MYTYPGEIKGLTVSALTNIAEFEKQPLEQRFPIDTSYGLIRQAGSLYGTNVAIEQLIAADRDEQPSPMSFSQFATRVTQTANLLVQLGIQRTDTVSILLPNLTENQIALWGSQAAGIANPINHFLQVEHIVEIMNEAKSKVLITLAPSHSTELGAKVNHVIEQVPTLESILIVRYQGASDLDKSVLGNSDVNLLDFERAVEKQPGDALSCKPAIQGKDIALYFHTGGTTGRPKIAQLTHANVAYTAQIYAAYNQHHGGTAVLNPLPLFHVFGVIAASLGGFVQARTVVLMTPDGFRNPNVVKNWWYFVERYQVSQFVAVPTILAALLEVPIANNDIGCLKYISCGSAPLSIALKKACEDKFNAIIYNGYGMTESTCLISRCIHGFDLPADTVGNRVPYTQVITAHIESNKLLKVCEPGEPGVILVKGPNIFKGYLNPQDDAKAWIDDQWFNTGDVGIFDDNGCLKITGRAKDLIIRGGHNIEPQVIETALLQHSAVSQAVAIGQPDAYAGEIPVAYVYLKGDQRTTESELLAFCKSHIAERAAVPKRLEIIDALPLTAVGKVFKPSLRNMATEYAIDSVLTESGITTTVKAEFDPQRGQIINIRLSHPSDQAKVIELLAGFPVIVQFNE